MKKEKTKNSNESKGNLILYKTGDDTIRVEVLLHNETIWMPQKKMAELFDVDVRTISEHLQNIFKTGELSQDGVIRNFRNTADDGKKYQTNFYNLDAIIAVGYRVNSKKATQFRIWATQVLKEYVIKGFAMDDERLKNGQHFGKDYYEELLERIREIRASERRFYQKITDIYATSIDYDKDSEMTKMFFATVQNKLHYAITGSTASEIIYHRADSDEKNMGLMSRKDAPKGKIIKSDITIAKNYLNEDEIKKLNILVNAYLDLAEVFAMDQQPMTMHDRKERLDDFLKLSRKDILIGVGKITAKLAKEKAEKEYEKFRPLQDLRYLSDFDQFVQTIKKPKKE